MITSVRLIAVIKVMRNYIFTFIGGGLVGAVLMGGWILHIMHI